MHVGYSQSSYGYSLFTQVFGANIVVMLVYVDVLLITESNFALIRHAKDTLNKAFKVKDLGQLRYFLRIEILRSDKGILLDQRKYVLKLIS